MSVAVPDDRNALITKSSIEIAKTMIALATIAGTSIGSSASRSAWSRDAPRSRAASSYSGPIASSRPRTMITTKTSENVMWPIACADRAERDEGQQVHEDEEERRPHDDLGRHERRERDAARASRRRARASA